MSLATRLDVETVRLKFLLERNDSGAWGTDPDHTRGTVVLRSTDQTVDGTWKIYDPAIRLLSEDEARGTTLHLGDLVVTKSSGSAKHIGKTTLVNKAVADMRASFGNFMQRLRCKEGVDARFIWYLLNHEIVRRQFDELSTTSTGLSNLTGTTIGEVEVPMVGALEQRAIADFLDRETARIDTLIEEQQRLIDLLRERRRAVVAAAIADLPDWTRLKYKAEIQTGITLSGEGDPDWPEWPYLRVANVQVGSVDLSEVKMIRVQRDVAASSRLKPGDVLMTEGGDLDKLGRGALWKGDVRDALHQNHVFAVRPSEQLLPEFLVYLLEAPEARTYFETTARKTTNLASTNKRTLGNLPLPCPRISEQREVVALLDEQTSKIGVLIVEAERFIELARERRAALITAAVTGQIDFRAAV